MSETPTTTAGMRQVEDRLGQPLNLYLDAAYNERRLSMEDIAAEIGVNRSTVHRWMRLLGVRGIRYVGYTGRRT